MQVSSSAVTVGAGREIIPYQGRRCPCSSSLNYLTPCNLSLLTTLKAVRISFLTKDQPVTFLIEMHNVATARQGRINIDPREDWHRDPFACGSILD